MEANNPKPKVDAQRKETKKTLKDITNRLKARLIIVKNSKPSSMVNGGEMNKEFRGLKRPSEVWRGEGSNGPQQKSRLIGRARAGFTKWKNWVGVDHRTRPI